MKHHLKLLIAISILTCSLPVFSKTDPYETGTLLNIELDSHTKTSYMIAPSNYLTTVAPISKVKNTYYFQIKLNDLIYTTSFSPRWGNEIDTNWIIGRSINVRLNDKKNRMYVQKLDGGKIKTKVRRVVSV